MRDDVLQLLRHFLRVVAGIAVLACHGGLLAGSPEPPLPMTAE
jgi:hypothetical protein